MIELLGKRRYRWVFAWSLANLAMMGVWSILLPFVLVDNVYVRARPGVSDFLAAIALTAMLGAIVFYVVRSWDRRAAWQRWLLAVLAVTIVVNAVRIAVNWPLADILATLRRPHWFVAALAGTACAVWVRQRLCGAAVALVFVFSPLAVINMAQAAWGAWESPPRRAPPSPITDAGAVSAPIVMVVFDEWDYRLSFPGRPAFLDMPEVDHVVAEAFAASQAYSPSDLTRLAMSSYLAIGSVTSAVGAGGGIEVAITDGRQGDLADQARLLRDLRDAGLRVGVVGSSTLAYCQALLNVLDDCKDADLELIPVNSPSFRESLARQATYLVPWYFGRRISERRHQSTITWAERSLAERRVDFLLVHMMVPHDPFIFDRRANRFVPPRAPSADAYFDNLILVDRTVGRLRATLEREGLWDQSVMILTSDHSFRASPRHDDIRDFRVPVIVKLPGQKTPSTYSKPFNTVAISDLVVALAQGRGPLTHADVASFIEGAVHARLARVGPDETERPR